ncbi:MAG: xanthine dehydrogenase family protein molybdopterin-binding subunit [Mesorhizobium sp.]|uniref:xanthine dehydrogenase family protein molybdopterin-binding subunit n=1 Tax=Mesorhizobium sp. TaxID=1871066 RepID=UPI000FE62940|nr:xanthine dehydrogenase family protein molybdopterin-binding subunit [Mesorhizobium sp.]RWI57125.1 MAG: xanthine dehydrogenase family protein molybdopterin-binding subunit [Mesorhizobium sp.]
MNDQTTRIPASRQREKPGQKTRWIGTDMKRVEDPRLLTGQGRYADDLSLPGMLHAATLASPHAHARIMSIDASKARALPGVFAVMTGEEVATSTGPLPCFANPPVEQRCVAVDRVRHVGEPVAIVAAESRYIAEDAVRLIEVEYEPLPPMNDPRKAMHATGNGVLHPSRGDTNVAIHRNFYFGDVAGDFARAKRIVKRSLRWPRSGAQPLETCGAVSDYDSATGKFTIHVNSSMYNYVGWLLAVTLGVPVHKLNIVPTLAGGSFGSKLFLHKVPVISAVLARETGRPVKYLEDRADNIMACDHHGSDRFYDCELALDENDMMISMRCKVVDDYGAYFQFGIGHHGNALSQITGPYQIGSVEADITAVMTNKCQQGAYRGFGSEVSNYVMERMVDAACSEFDLDPVEFRRKNFIKAEQFPYFIPTGNLYDSGNYPAVLDKALQMLDYNGWRRKQEEARKEGRYIGIGLATCQERSVFSATEFWMLNREAGFALTSSPEGVKVKIDPIGNAVITLQAPFWGNSPETMATMLLAEHLTMDPANISVTYADTDSGISGTGPGGSRFTVMVAGAIVSASQVIRKKLFLLGAHLLDADPSEMELVDGKVRVKGRQGVEKSIADLAIMAHFFRLSFPDTPEFDTGLDASCTYDHPLTTMPSDDRKDLGIFYPIMGHMCHMPVVEVDIETGTVKFLDYVAVHDCGTIVNPMTLAGHVRGGTAQGIGSAIYEEYKYDDDGQLLNASFADYILPSVNEVPSNIRVGHVTTPSPFTEYGIKGGGEGGRMGAPPAMASAIEDALKPFGVKADFLPLTPSKLRGLIRQAAAGH